MTGGIVSAMQNTFTLSGALSITDGNATGIPDPSFASTGTLVLDGGADQNFTKGANTTLELTNLTLENSGGGTSDDIVANVNGGLNLSGALTITSGNLDLDSNGVAMVVERGITLADDSQATLTTDANMTVSGTILVNDSAIITVTGGTLTLNDDGDQSVDIDGQSIYNLTINNTGGGTNDDIIIAGGTLQLSGALTVTLGNLDLDTGTLAMIVERGITIADAAQATLTTDGNITASGSVSVGAGGTLTMNDSNTLTMNGDDQNLDTNGAPLKNLTIASSSGTTLTSNQTVEIALQVNTGSTFALDSYTLLATGSSVINYATVNEDTGMIYHTGSNVLITNSAYAEDNAHAVGNTMYFTITDTDENIDGTAADTVVVNVSGDGDSEAVTLTETNNTSGVFRGSIATQNATVSASGGTLEISTDGATVTLSFGDHQDALIATDTATVATAGPSAADSNTTDQGSGGGGRGSGRRSPGGQGYGAAPSVPEEEADKGAAEDISDAVGGQLPNKRGLLEVTAHGAALVLKDVPVKDWFAKYIFDIVKAGIASGYKDARGRLTGEFGPANNVTYAEIAKMASESASIPPLHGSATPRNRSARGQWSAKYIAGMEELGVSVFGDPALDINSPAPRGAVLQILLETFGTELTEATGTIYNDVSSGTDHASAIETATTDGIVSGDDDKNTFRPRHPINRAEISKVVIKAIEAYGN